MRGTVTSMKLQLKKSVVQIAHTGIKINLNIHTEKSPTIAHGHQTRQLEKPVATVARDVFVNKTGTFQGHENI